MKRVSFYLYPKVSAKFPRSPPRLTETCASAYFILLMNEKLVSKESVVPRRWEGETRIFGTKHVDEGQIASVKRGSLRNDDGNNNNATN